MDVTEFNLRGEKCYLSSILDDFNGEVISYNNFKSPNLEQINDVLNKSFDKNNNLDGLVFHSDQALLKTLYLTTINVAKKWTGRIR